MARSSSILDRSCRPKRRSFVVPAKALGTRRRAPLLLYFPVDAKALRTPFRARVLQSIYEIARQELGSRLVSASVQASADPNDPGHIRLLLSIWADVDSQAWNAADKAVGEAVFEKQAAWAEDERADYLRTIDFEILPLKA